ncbi:hypothetical protein CLV92_105282 [Kineococcus xinjiangensis]|uniref:Uncharacterized protein n=1 Tax=Kineococcus xinjiangensis TaxID=512762 RepID=A0A2S6IPW8_9ACTN|nr:hypothetical protein CLV92_105282 [Kineococcus xinjiangensis]
MGRPLAPRHGRAFQAVTSSHGAPASAPHAATPSPAQPGNHSSSWPGWPGSGCRRGIQNLSATASRTNATPRTAVGAVRVRRCGGRTGETVDAAPRRACRSATVERWTRPVGRAWKADQRPGAGHGPRRRLHGGAGRRRGLGLPGGRPRRPAARVLPVAHLDDDVHGAKLVVQRATDRHKPLVVVADARLSHRTGSRRGCRVLALLHLRTSSGHHDRDPSAAMADVYRMSSGLVLVPGLRGWPPRIGTSAKSSAAIGERAKARPMLWTSTPTTTARGMKMLIPSAKRRPSKPSCAASGSDRSRSA